MSWKKRLLAKPLTILVCRPSAPVQKMVHRSSIQRCALASKQGPDNLVCVNQMLSALTQSCALRLLLRAVLCDSYKCHWFTKGKCKSGSS